MNAALSPYAFADLPTVLAYLNRGGTDQADVTTAAQAGNAAVGWMERRTQRRLAARTYRTAVTIDCGTTINDTTVTGTGFTALKVLDDVVGAGLPAGARVASITSDTALELNVEATATDASVDLTFGSAPLTADGDGGGMVYVPEYPVREVYGVSWLDAAGTATALSTTGARIVDREGRYLLPAGVPAGDGNIAIECCAGYAEPTGTDRGDWAEWGDLQRIFLRCAQIYHQDAFTSRGRIVSNTLLSQGVQLPDFRMPADVEDGIKPYVRLG